MTNGSGRRSGQRSGDLLDPPFRYVSAAPKPLPPAPPVWRNAVITVVVSVAVPVAVGALAKAYLF